MNKLRFFFSLLALFSFFAVPAAEAKKKAAIQLADSTFVTGPDALKYVHVVIQFRDPDGEKWPSIGWGRA